MSAHPMMSNAIHARVQRKRIEMRNEICAKKAAEPVMATMLTQEAIAAAVTQPNALPTIRKHQNVGHHHVNHGNTLMIGGFDQKEILSIAQKLFARRIIH